MPVRFAYWTDRALAKIAEHGVKRHEVEHVLNHPIEDEASRANPRNMRCAGYTANGRFIVVVYRPIEAAGLWVAPITAYEPTPE